MLLQALRAYGAGMSGARTGPPMFEEKRVRYEVHLDSDGRPLGLVVLSGDPGSRTDRGLPMFIPASLRGGTAVRPKLLADTLEYALGWGDPAKAARYHPAFIELVRECAAETGEPSVLAVLRYLERPQAERLPPPAQLDVAANATFSVDGIRPIELPSVRAFWARRARRGEGAGDALPATQCLVCSERKPVIDRVPFKIMGLGRIGGQGAGSALISANKNVFESYGLSASRTSPICGECAELSHKALNALIDDDATRLFLGPLLYVFWTREPTTFNWGEMFSRPSSEQVQALLTAARSGRRGELEIDPNAFYCAALAGSGGRVVVRDWIDTTVEGAKAHLARAFARQHIVDRGGQPGAYLGMYQLVRALEPPGKGDVAPGVPRVLMRAALHGDPLPDWLLAQTLRRVQAEQGQVGHARAALIKMVLASPLSDDIDELEGFMSGLDPENRDPAYLCGRLLAVLDAVQRAALGATNATIIDRFFGAASTAPISVFGRLVRGAQPHLAKLRRDRPGAYVALEARMQEILAGIGEFPHTLSLRQQGAFVLGYYHQRADDIARAMARRAERAAGAEPDDASDVFAHDIEG